MARSPRLPPLSDEQLDDEARTLVTASWFSDRPTNGQNFFKTFVRHRDLFRVWNDFGRVLFNSKLPDRDRELLIMRTAWLTRCTFEWAYHEPLARQLGFSDEEIEGVLEGPDALCWSELDAALLRAVDDLYLDAVITDKVWAVLRTAYDDLQLIEVPLVVGQYQLVAYFNNTMGVEPAAGLPHLPQPSRG